MFLVHSFNCRSLAKRECKASQGSVKTLVRWGGKHLYFCMANLHQMYTKFYQNRPGFMKEIKKHVGVFFRFTV